MARLEERLSEEWVRLPSEGEAQVWEDSMFVLTVTLAIQRVELRMTPVACFERYGKRFGQTAQIDLMRLAHDLPSDAMRRIARMKRELMSMIAVES